MSSTGTELPKQPRITNSGKIDRRGNKKCPKCRVKVGVRKIICDCGHIFKPKTKRKNQILDWKSLCPGDKIKVSGGSFYLSEDENGNTIPRSFGYTGVAVVAQVYQDGIRIFEDTNETAFVYMGKDYVTDIGIHKRAATLIKYKPKKTKFSNAK